MEDHHFISIETTTKSSDYKVKQSGFDKSAKKRGDNKQYSISHKKTRAELMCNVSKLIDLVISVKGLKHRLKSVQS